MTSEKPTFDWLHEGVVNNPSFLSAFEKEYSQLVELKPLPREHHVSPPPAVLEKISKELHPYLLGENLWEDFMKLHALNDAVLLTDIKHIVGMLIEGGELQEEAKNIVRGEIERGSILGRAFELTARFETTLVDAWYNSFDSRKQSAASTFNQKWRGEDHDLYVAVYGPDLAEARNVHLKKKNLESPPKVVAEGTGIVLQGHFSYEEGEPYSDIRNKGFLIFAGATVETDFPGQVFFIDFDTIKIPDHLRRRYDRPKQETDLHEEIPLPIKSNVENLELEYPMLEKEDSWASPPNKIKPFIEKRDTLRQYLKPGDPPPPNFPVYRGARGGNYFVAPQHLEGQTRESPFTLESSRQAAIKFFGAGGDKFLSSAYPVDVPGYSSRLIHAGPTSSDVPDDSSLETRVNIYDSNNKRVGHLIRTFYKTPTGIHAGHDEFSLLPEHQGKGIATSISRNAEEAYSKAGIKHIELEAGKSIGGYAWALHGYDFHPDMPALPSMRKHFSSAVKSLAIREQLPQWDHIQKKFPQIDVDRAKSMIDDVYKMNHSWDFARYNPFSNKHGDHFGKHVMLGTSWPAHKSLDPKSPGYQVGQAYYRAKQKIGSSGG